MLDPWASVSGLAAIKRSLLEALPQWRTPLAFAVGTVAEDGTDPRFGHTNSGSAAAGLSPVLLATVVGHPGGTATVELAREDLAAAIETMTPAKACTDIAHPNLAAWEKVLAELKRDRTRRAVAVWVCDRGDAVTSEADAALRSATGLG